MSELGAKPEGAAGDAAGQPPASRWPKRLFVLFQLISMALVYLGPVAWEVPALLSDMEKGLAPRSLGIFALLLAPLPPLCWFLGARTWRGEPARLLQLVVGFQLPLMGVAVVRLYKVHELTAAHLQVLGTVCIGALFSLWDLLRGPPQPSQSRGVVGLQLGGQTLGLLGAAYGLLVYAPLALRWLGDVDLRRIHANWFDALMGLIVLPFLLYGVFVLAAAPLLALRLYARSLRVTYGVARTVLGGRTARLVSAAVVLLSLGLFLIVNRQPQIEVYRRLRQLPRSDQERMALLRDAAGLREGLLNAYLQDERYWGPSLPSRLPGWMYATEKGPLVLALPWASIVRYGLEGLYGAVARPFLYDNAAEYHGGRADEAAEAYADFFDAPIAQTEVAAILTAFAADLSHHDRKEKRREALGRGVRRTWQGVQATRHGDVAEIELHEVYESTATWDSYSTDDLSLYFALPESAVVTGMWLGGSSDRSQASECSVDAHPRRNNPLTQGEQLEPVGPRQYRVRILAGVRSGLWDRSHATPIPRHLWLRYRVLSDGVGFALPERLLERNVHDTPSTKKVLEGRELAPGEEFPPRLLGAGERVTHLHHPGLNVDIQARPVSSPPPQWPAGRTLAVVVDRSRSMSRVQAEAESALRTLVAVAGQNDLDFYLTSAPTRGEPAVRIDDPMQLPHNATFFYGRHHLDGVLAQFQSLRGKKAYDALVLLTDDDGWDPPKWQAAATLGDLPPLWMVHLGGRLAPSYSDVVHLALVRSGGGVTTELAGALSAIERAASGRSGQILDGYEWTQEPAPPGAPRVDEAFSALAAARLVRLHAATGSRKATSAVDTLHELAKANHIATVFTLLAPPAPRPRQPSSPAPKPKENVAPSDGVGEGRGP
ncbi:MAG TPA: TIGR02921 family PEP-CTERM protein [Pseudomonadota bacterium]|nr:TIGR02921 family PEP-CTERM protein [Pseudomonadota bacterium]